MGVAFSPFYEKTLKNHYKYIKMLKKKVIKFTYIFLKN